MNAYFVRGGAVKKESLTESEIFLDEMTENQKLRSFEITDSSPK